ncbi:MAG: zinc-dependent alcohol dehydrogenase family protein [Burkholderiaceae bacterium]
MASGMRAQVLTDIRQPLQLETLPLPEPGPQELLLEVSACGVCRTDLHIVDGELPASTLPLVPGHEIVGRVVDTGGEVDGFQIGDRVGVPWLGWTCGSCEYCRSGQENLCNAARFTGYQINGGYADHTVADARYCFPIPPRYSDAEAAPLLCAGLIGYRALRMVWTAKRIGLYGFGAAAHLLAQLCVQQGREIYAFVRPRDEAAKEFARKMGAKWAGDSTTLPPVSLDAALLFAPVGETVPAALRAVSKGGSVVCAGIHMTDIPSFPYELLWGERILRSVANLTRADGAAFFEAAARYPLHSQVQTYPLERANQALNDLRGGKLQGAAVLVPSH